MHIIFAASTLSTIDCALQQIRLAQGCAEASNKI
jgi:hypothetical protein